jgi:DNA-binding NtrC family response regulator
VRELSNVIERASILACGREITSEELPAEVREGDSLPMALKLAVEHFEARHIAWVLQLAAGNKNRAAELLGVDPATLYRKLAKYNPG